MKQRDRPSLRLSEPLQAVVERAGDSGAAIRALMILGAAVAGEDLAPLQREIRLLLLDNTLSGALQRGLSALSDSGQTSVRQVSDVPQEGPLTTLAELGAAPAAPAEQADDDPFAGLGFEV